MTLPQYGVEVKDSPSTPATRLQAKTMYDFVSQFDKPFMEKQPIHVTVKLQQEIREIIDTLHDIAPALTVEQKVEIYDVVGPIQNKGGNSQLNRAQDEFFGSPAASTVGVLDINAITAQYLLVEHIRDTILDPNNTIKHKATPRELSALISSISNVVSLFLKNQDKIELLKEVQSIKRAVSYALQDAPMAVRTKFLEKFKQDPG